MTRDKIKKLIDNYGSSCINFGMDLGSPLKNPADEICNDFESKYCINCKFEKDNIMSCAEGIDRPYTYKGATFPHFIKPFGCNRWEQR